MTDIIILPKVDLSLRKVTFKMFYGKLCLIISYWFEQKTSFNSCENKK